MILLAGFAFLSGLLTIFAPCVWPLLPVVLATSAVGRSRASVLGIVLGLTGSFGLLTLGTSYAVDSLHLDPNTLRLVAVIVIAYLGVSMLVPRLGRLHEVAFSRLAGRFTPAANDSSMGLAGGLLMGASLGVVWSPCAGPILATITALAVTAQVSGNLILVTTAYLLGVGFPLFAVAYGGQRLVRRLNVMTRFSGQARRIFGAIVVLAAVGIYTKYDKVAEAQLLNVAPQYSQALTGFENDHLVRRQLVDLQTAGQTRQVQPVHKSIPTCPKALCSLHYRAPELAGITHWLNTAKPLSLHALKGHVVLIHFWTFDCINCIHTLPNVVNWYDKYQKYGFVVLGVHSPEFSYEKDTGNVRDAIRRFNIRYPVPQDNNFATWHAYSNVYWPAEYLIDAHGYVRRLVEGEGSYGDTESAIRALLRESGKRV